MIINALRVFVITFLSGALILHLEKTTKSAGDELFIAIAPSILFYFVVDYIISRWRKPGEI